MSSRLDATDTTPARPSLAPPWHTAALVILIVAVATLGTILSATGRPAPTARATPTIQGVYLPFLLVQSALAVYVCRVGRPRSALRSLLGRGWDSVGRALGDLALAGAGWLLIEGSEIVWRAVVLHGAHGPASAMLPHTMPERLVWVLVAFSAGIAEELVYRGYLQTQFAAFTRRTNVAIVLQSALFGIAHLDQGIAGAARLMLYGIAFGTLARWRRSLLPGIVCHVWTDLASGLLLS